MDLDQKICNAERCVVEIADAYVKASNIGGNTEAMLNELVLMEGYIDALNRYEPHPKRHVKRTTLLTDGNILLSDNNKILSLKSCSLECVDPDEINCLTQDDVCFILEQINIRCSDCECNC